MIGTGAAGLAGASQAVRRLPRVLTMKFTPVGPDKQLGRTMTRDHVDGTELPPGSGR